MALKDKIFEVMGGKHVAAVATVSAGKPAVRFMALEGQDDLSLVGATMKNSRKVDQIRNNPEVALSIWSGKEFSDPYVVIHGKVVVHEDIDTKRKFWDPTLEPYLQNPENPDYVVLKFIPQRIEYYYGMSMEVWER